MKSVLVCISASVVVLVSGAAWAQGGPGGGTAPRGAGPAASAPGPGMGPGMAPGMGPGMGSGMGPGMGPRGAGMAASGPGSGPAARWGSDYTPGWSMMTSEERKSHQEHMRSMNSYEECHAYVMQHHEQMAQRAQEKGGKPLAPPRRDACAGLKR